MQESQLQEIDPLAQMRTTAILIVNPTSGSYQAHSQQILETVTFLNNHGWLAELKHTQKKGDASRLTREAVEHHLDVVVAIGGDGTINEIIQELAGSDTALGVIPSGTVNVWAREVGIPLDICQARQILVSGQQRRIDLGNLDNHYFLLMTGIGFDGEVTHAVEKKPAKRLGVLGYLLVGAWLGIHYTAFRTILKIGERTMKTNALQIIIGNTQLYGGALKYTWHAKCDDGQLDVCIVRKQNLPNRIMVLIDFFLRRKQRQQWVHYATGSVITIRTRKPIAIQIDGDPWGYTRTDTPSIIRVVPKALKVIVPQILPDELFQRNDYA